MLRVNKVEVLNNIIENCERKIIDIKLEIRLLERKKISGGQADLVPLSNQITGDKDLVKFYEDKIEVANDELESESKRSTVTGSPAPKGAKG